MVAIALDISVQKVHTLRANNSAPTLVIFKTREVALVATVVSCVTSALEALSNRSGRDSASHANSRPLTATVLLHTRHSSLSFRAADMALAASV